MCFSSDSRAVHIVRNGVHGGHLITTDILGVAMNEAEIQNWHLQPLHGLRSFSPYIEKFAVLFLSGNSFLLFDETTATARYPTHKLTQYSGHGKFSPDGSFVGKIEDNGDVKIFDTLTGEIKKTLNLGPFSNEPLPELSLAISANSRIIAIVSRQWVHIWDIHSGRIKDVTPPGIQFDSVLAVSSCGHKIVASYHNDNERSFGIWDVTAGTQLQKLSGASYSDVYYNCLFTPDDKYLWTNRGFLSLNPDSGTLPLQQDDPNLCLLVSKDWITRAGEPILWLPPDYRPTAQAVSDDTVVLICDGN